MTKLFSAKEILIVTAYQTEGKKLSVLAHAFARNFSLSEYSLVSQIDPSLLGGFVVYFEGYRYDYSVRGQLERLALQMKNPDPQMPSTDSSEDLKEEIKRIRTSFLQAIEAFDEDPTALFDVRFKDHFCIKTQSDALKQGHESSDKGFSSMQQAPVDEIGRVISVGDGVAFVKGIEHCVLGERILLGPHSSGVAMNLEEKRVGLMLLGQVSEVVEGLMCRRTGKTIEIPVGEGLLGRVIDPLGKPIDGKGTVRTHRVRPIESPAPSILERSPINTPLQTGITVIDALTPIGRGQRELIIGDRQTGKTAVAIDTIINQRGKNIFCVYVAIGQKLSTIVQTVQTLEKHHALSYTVVVAAGASEQASMQYIAPYAGCAIAEYFMNEKNADVLIVYDDLTKHAHAYRAISLLLRRPPGREAYPGDIFYIHSSLLERAANLAPDSGGGSITALPIIETQGGDVSAYIPTNMISITDGQIYLENDLFFAGQRPAVNAGLSLSRIGGAAQTNAMKKLAGPLRINLAQARDMAAFAQFGSDLDENTQLQIKRGEILSEILKQPQFHPLSVSEQIVLLYLATSEKLLFLKKEEVRDYVFGFLKRLSVFLPEILITLEKEGDLNEEMIRRVDVLEREHKEAYIAEHNRY